MFSFGKLAGFIRRCMQRHANEDGLAAIEFAMIVPIMVVLFLGAVEFSEALTVDRRVTAVASATADLVAQTEEVSDADLNDIMRIADSLLGRIDPAPMQITIISIVSDVSGNFRVDWSYGSGAGAYAPNSSYTDIPAEMIQPGVVQSLVIAEVSYTYTPPVGHFITGSITLSERFLLSPRRSLKVEKI